MLIFRFAKFLILTTFQLGWGEPHLESPTKRVAVPGTPHEQICSTWNSPRTELVYQDSPRTEVVYLGLLTNRIPLPGSLHGQTYQGLPANRIALPETSHEQNCFTRDSPRTELLNLGHPTNRIYLPGSTWDSPRKELLYQGLPTNRIALPGTPHEQNYENNISL